MKKRIISAILLILVLSFYWYQEISETKDSNSVVVKTDIDNSDFNFLPTSTTGAIVHHNSYSLSYSEKHEQAEWIAYSLDKKDIVYKDRKGNCFLWGQLLLKFKIHCKLF